MIDFHYAGLASNGKPCQGVVRAADAASARLRLLGQGVTPVSITDHDSASADSASPAGGKRLKRSEVLLFTREMAHLKRANMPLDKSLALLKGMAVTDRLRQFVVKVESAVRGGKSLHQALQPYESELGSQYLVLIKAGEASGALGEVLNDLTRQLEEQDRLRNHVISVLTYPMILLVVAILSVVMLLAFVVPQFREIFDSMGDALPLSTRMVLSISDFLRSHWVWLVILLALVVGATSRWINSPAGRVAWDRIRLKIPLLGAVLRSLEWSIYFRTLGVLLQRGVPLVEALRIAGDALSNKALQAEVSPLVSAVKSGKRLSVGFASVTSAGAGVVPLIKVAEETGELDPVLLGLAERFEVEGQRTMTRVLAAMEPLIIIVLGMMVAFIIVSILSGVLSINNTI